MTILHQHVASRSQEWFLRVLAMIALLACAMLLTNCNTTEGVGKDVKSLGQGIQDTANDSRDRD